MWLQLCAHRALHIPKKCSHRALCVTFGKKRIVELVVVLRSPGISFKYMFPKSVFDWMSALGSILSSSY